MIELLIEFVVEIGVELLFGVAGEWAAAGRRRREPSSPGPRRWLAAVAIVGAGAGLGYLGSLAFPARVLPKSPVPGLSLVVGPLACGALLAWLGKRRRAAGRFTTPLATFWGGASFAAALALTRFLLVR